MRGVPQSGLWSEVKIALSGTGSERAKVASVADAEAPREPGVLEGKGVMKSFKNVPMLSVTRADAGGGGGGFVR